MAAYVQDSNFFTRRTIVLFAIIGLHVFIAWALATGLARRAIELVAPPIQTEIVEEVQKHDEPPPPPPPQMERPPVEIPPPDVAIEVPVENAIDRDSGRDRQARAAAAAAAARRRSMNRTPAGRGKTSRTADDYLSAGVEASWGRGLGQSCMCAWDRTASSRRIRRSRRHPAARGLDEGAMKLAKAGSGTTSPAPKTASPSPACVEFKIKFELH